MATLAEEFMNDLADDGEEEEKETFDIAEDFNKNTKEEDGDDDDEMEITTTGKEAKDLVHILNSDKLEELLKRIDESVNKKDKKNTLAEQDAEYVLVLDSNQMTLEINKETATLHRFVKEKYSKKFPELESLVVNPLDYARVVQRIGNEMDLTKVTLTDILPSATIMAVTVTATTSGTPLTEENIQQVLEGCKYILALDEKKKKIVEYVEGRMNIMAPNLSVIVGTAIAAKLMSAAGGLANLSKLPSDKFIALGATKKILSGLSTASIKTRAGFIFETDIIRNTPQAFKVKAVRFVSGKAALAARVDASNDASSRDGSVGLAYRELIEKKLEKMQEPPPMKMVKPLAAPDDRPKKRRGGKRMRAIKQKFETTDLRKAANRIAFGTEAQESILSGDTEKSLGMIGQMGTGTGKVRLAVQDKGVLKKQKLAASQSGVRSVYGTSGATSGLSSSLAFTPVQGLELKVEKVKEANEKYFNAMNSFKKS